MGGTREARIWALIAECAREDGAPVSVRHTCLASAAAIRISGASLTVFSGPDRRDPVACVGPLSERLEELQFTLGEGPCVDALVNGGPVLAYDLFSPRYISRWPTFAPAAVSAGAGALFAFPLQSGAVRLGVLDLYRTEPGPLNDDELADALVLSDTALTLLLDDHAGVPPRAGPSEHRFEVYQAAGMVSVQLDVDIADALIRLRAHAFVHDLRLARVAREVVERRLRFTAEMND